MPYSGTLFGKIPYDLTDSATPIYEPQIIEEYLVEHYESKDDALNDIVRVLHDDKHQGNMMCVETKSTEGNYWYPKTPSDLSDEEYEAYSNDSNAVGLDFQIAYEYIKKNIVKLACDELGITKNALNIEKNRILIAKKLIEMSSKNKDDIKRFEEIIANNIENISYEADVRDIMENEIMKENNIVKLTCKELGLTYKELGEKIGYSESAIKMAVSKDKISEPMIKAIELYKRNLELEKELENSNKIKSTLKEWLK